MESCTPALPVAMGPALDEFLKTGNAPRHLGRTARPLGKRKVGSALVLQELFRFRYEHPHVALNAFEVLLVRGACGRRHFNRAGCVLCHSDTMRTSSFTIAALACVSQAKIQYLHSFLFGDNDVLPHHVSSSGPQRWTRVAEAGCARRRPCRSRSSDKE